MPEKSRSSQFAVLFGVLVSVGSVKEIPDPGRSGETDYCGEGFNCGDVKHLACTHKERTSGEMVAGVDSGRPIIVRCSELRTCISPKERGVVLKTVNDFRNNIAGAVAAGSSIRQLTWDYELENFAKIVATNTANVTDYGNYRYWVHVCAKTELGTTTAVFFTHDRNTSYDVQRIVGTWGRHMLSPVGGDKLPKLIPARDNVHSLTALASATATKMGCGYSDGKCGDGSGPAKDITTVACIVGFEVDPVGRPIFKTGIPCSNCPPDTKCNPKSQWPKLCASPGDPEKTVDIPDPSSAPPSHLSLIISTLIFTPLLF